VSDLISAKKKATPVSPAQLVECMKALQPRLYSIASSPLATPGEVHLCVAVVRYSVCGRPTGGVASTWMCDRLKIGDEIPVFVQRNSDFRLPDTPSTPKIMIGPGTGVAPFMSFLKHDEVVFCLKTSSYVLLATVMLQKRREN